MKTQPGAMLWRMATLMAHEAFDAIQAEMTALAPEVANARGFTLSDAFLKKHAFDEKKTDEMERRDVRRPHREVEPAPNFSSFDSHSAK
jgi:hypothetical protein